MKLSRMRCRKIARYEDLVLLQVAARLGNDGSFVQAEGGTMARAHFRSKGLISK